MLNNLIDQTTGQDGARLTSQAKEARLNLVNSLVSGIAAHTGVDASTATTAASIEGENNSLIKGAKIVLKTTKATIESYRKHGKVKVKVKVADLKQTMKDEGLSIADNLLTLADGELTVDNALAIIDLAVGTEFNKAHRDEALRKIEQIERKYADRPAQSPYDPVRSRTDQDLQHGSDNITSSTVVSAETLAKPALTMDAASGAKSGTVAMGSVADANFAQSTIRASEIFSKDGIAKYSQLAGRPINTVNDLAEALQSGAIKPNQIPVDYVVGTDGTKLIINTRTSVALDRAGIPKSDWYGTNKTRVSVPDMPGKTFDDLAADQLKNNKLPSTGTPIMPKGKN